MRILNARVYVPKSSNTPKLELLVDKINHVEDFLYDTKELAGGTAYFAELDGDVSFFHHIPKIETGYGGRVFNVTLKTGEHVAVKGPWSSRPSIMGPLFNVPCMDVNITDSEQTFDRGYTFMAGTITVELAKTVLRFLPDWEIIEEDFYNEKAWRIRTEWVMK